MKTLEQIENDKRISCIETLSANESEARYFVWLNEGYVIDGDSHMFSANNVKEINEILKEIEIEK